MRLILESSCYTDPHYQRVEIEIKNEGPDVIEMRELLRSALLAWSFHPDTVNEIICDV